MVVNLIVSAASREVKCAEYKLRSKRFAKKPLLLIDNALHAETHFKTNLCRGIILEISISQQFPQEFDT